MYYSFIEKPGDSPKYIFWGVMGGGVPILMGGTPPAPPPPPSIQTLKLTGLNKMLEILIPFGVLFPPIFSKFGSIHFFLRCSVGLVTQIM